MNEIREPIEFFKEGDEIWGEIPGFPKYEASNTGFVRRKGSNKPLSPNTNSKGYHHVILYIKDKYDKHTVGVHRAVALTFLPNFDLSLTVNHIDENPDNNRLENLEWMENGDNTRYSQGIKVRCVELDKVFNSIGEASRYTGIARATISFALKNPNYESNDIKCTKPKRNLYTWEYVE